MNVSTLARQDVAALPLYSADTAPCAVDVSDNTNLWGTSPAVLDAVAALGASEISRYPALYSESLRDTVAAYLGIQNDDVGAVVGCGSDNVLDSAMRAFAERGDSIAFCDPTFSMIPVFARLNGLELVRLSLHENFDVDAERLVAAHAKLTYLCTPNNPTATTISRAAVEYVCEHASGVVIIDEAYAEFADDSFVDLANRHEHVLVTRTCSKAFGMAGLRAGYGVGARTLTRLVERARGPYTLNIAAEAAMRAAFSERGLEWMRSRRDDALQSRILLRDALRARALEPLESHANFVCVPLASAAETARGLRERGALVRALGGLPTDIPAFANSAGSALRIGVGPVAAMDTVLAAYDEVRACA